MYARGDEATRIRGPYSKHTVAAQCCFPMSNFEKNASMRYLRQHLYSMFLIHIVHLELEKNRRVFF